VSRRAEQQKQKAVIEHLAWRARPNVLAFHVPLGGYRRPVEAAILRSIGVVADIPDLLIVHSGQLYCLELKSERGRLSPAQIKTHEQLRAAGATVATAVGIDQAIQQLEHAAPSPRSRQGVSISGADRDGKPSAPQNQGELKWI
jgi:hypothetical protein